MKKILSASLVIAAALFLASLSFAEDMKDMKKGMMGHMMMKSMMDKSVVATSDGGIVVVAGNKITKYDKDLNVVKEVEIKVDAEAMQKQMGEMMKMCPMMGDMKDMGGESGGTADAAAEGGTDHASHH